MNCMYRLTVFLFVLKTEECMRIKKWIHIIMRHFCSCGGGGDKTKKKEKKKEKKKSNWQLDIVNSVYRCRSINDFMHKQEDQFLCILIMILITLYSYHI